MKIRTLVLASFATVILLGALFIYRWVIDSIRPTYLNVVEENLVDTANLLASLVETDPRPLEVSIAALDRASHVFRQARFQALIYNTLKESTDTEFYLTDSSGIVLFHSHDPLAIGSDYSQWNDVFLTLNKKYGARSTRTDPDDPSTSRLHVAAPVVKNGSIVGVVTVIKPIHWPFQIIEKTRRHVWLGALLLSGLSLLLGLLLSSWITRPIEHLTHYAEALASGQPEPRPPPARTKEIRRLTSALINMRQALEGKEYVEQYTTTLTHEIKSPLAGIRGAAELLSEHMEREERGHFIDNIRKEAQRIERIVNQLLRLSEIETMGHLEQQSLISPTELIEAVAAEHRAGAASREIALDLKIPENQGPATVEGDPRLLHLALSCLLQNAIEFAPRQSTVSLSLQSSEACLILQIQDRGPGIPGYALPRIFERFYSLPRPETGKKSSGLGLSLARSIILLHRGKLEIHQPTTGGTIAEVTLPLHPKV
ncbi:MAG: two-component system sensor histidine kinase CreC [Puniceicoccaceae bacterium]